MANSLIASMVGNQDAIQAMYNKYEDLIKSTFLKAYQDYDNRDEHKYTTNRATTKQRMLRNMCKAATSHRTELVAIITALRALAAIPGSNLYGVQCAVLNVYILIHVHDRTASTKVFPEPGNKLEDDDLASLAMTFYDSGELFISHSVYAAVEQRNPDVASINHKGCAYPTRMGLREAIAKSLQYMQ
jgi:hypothetical protein